VIRWLVGLLLGVVQLGLLSVAHAQVDIPSLDGKLKLAGYWFKPQTTEPRPLVLALHGCGGALDAKGQLSPIWRRYAGYFNAEKIHFLVLDSFTPRGETSICGTATRRRTIHEEDRREDVYAALAWLTRHPSVDVTRIVVVGWSNGAQTVLSVMDASDTFVQAQTHQPRAAVAFYPGCAKFSKMWHYAALAPTLVMVGELDDWTPARACLDLREKVLRHQNDSSLELVVYPGSYHGFDSLGAVHTKTQVGNTRSGTATVGGNPQARVASFERLFDFVSAQLGEPLRLTHAQRLKVAPASQSPW
jgi:dienelactone hydrolase